HRSRHGRRRTRMLAGPALAAALVLAVACGDDDGDGGDGGGGTEGSAGAPDATLEITSLSYSDVTVPAEGTLEIVNSSGAPHTFTADDGSFDAPDVGVDDTVTVEVPDEPGDYPFHCEIHPSMTATLTAE